VLLRQRRPPQPPGKRIYHPPAQPSNSWSSATPDADHINSAWQVLQNYEVKKVLWTGFEASMVGGNTTRTFKRLDSMLSIRPDAENINLNELDSTITPGTGFSIGSAKFTFLCRFGQPHPDWSGLCSSEKLNAVSIVMKLEFKGNSILFTGDAVGRHLDDPADALLATEEFLVNNAPDLLPSTIVIAPHHGARNGSSSDFFRLTQPQFVIFPSGHNHPHPTTRTDNLYLQTVSVNNIYRTDRGDDEGTGEVRLLPDMPKAKATQSKMQ
jgi:beta-lactamase superfamily II metal-dependent hydrolase